MPIRLLLNDAVPKASITAANTAAEMPASNLQTDPKGEICRVLSGTATINLTWTAPETVGCVVIPACNLGASSTIRLRAYSDLAGTTLLEDTGVKLAAPGTVLGNWSFTQPLNVNAFSEDATLVVAYFNQHQTARKLVVDVADSGLSFIDMSKLVAGTYLEARVGADYGASVGISDMGSNTRSASGDIKTDWGPRNKKLNFNMNWIEDQDRARVLQLFKGGIGKWLFADLLPDWYDPVAQQDYRIFGKLQQGGEMQLSSFRLSSSQFQIEGY